MHDAPVRRGGVIILIKPITLSEPPPAPKAQGRSPVSRPPAFRHELPPVESCLLACNTRLPQTIRS